MRISVVAVAAGLMAFGHRPWADAETRRAQAGPVPSSEPQERTALRLGHDGLKLYEAGRFSEAYAQFAAAERLAHSPVFVLYMARCRVQSGNLLEAKDLFGRVAAERVPADAPEAWRRAVQEAETELEAIRARIPKVTITVKSGRGELAVQVDGRAVSPRELGGVFELDPGSHWVFVKDADGREVTRAFELKERDAQRIELTFAAQRARQPALQDSRPRRQQASSSPWRTAGYVALGAGAVGVGAGAVLGVMAKNKADEIKENCVDGHCLASDAPERDVALRLGDAATVAFVTGGVSLVAGALLVLLGPSEGSPARVSRARSAVALVPGSLGPGSVALRARF